MITLEGRNTWAEKAKRTLTSVLPIDPHRKGECNRCGHCCMLPNRCPFLRFDHEMKALCLIYKMRPLNCRKYPRVEEEHIAFPCGYYFEKPGESRKPDAAGRTITDHADCHAQ